MKIFLIKLVFLFGIVICLYQWENFDVNYHFTKDIHTSIHDGEHCNMCINSCGTMYDVSYIENASLDAINPYFPVIHIKAPKDCNGWLHVVRTDSSILILRVFIDAVQNS